MTVLKYQDLVDSLQRTLDKADLPAHIRSHVAWMLSKECYHMIEHFGDVWLLNAQAFIFKGKQHQKAINLARKAAKAKAERQQASDPHAWMIPYFERAYAELEAEGKAVIGRRKLAHEARQLALKEKIDLSRRRDISERRAEAFLKQRQSGLT